MPPRRVQDYAFMLVQDNCENINPEYNYYINAEKGYFIFNIYKTAKFYKVQRKF